MASGERRALSFIVDYSASDFVHANLWRLYFRWPQAIAMWLLIAASILGTVILVLAGIMMPDMKEVWWFTPLWPILIGLLPAMVYINSRRAFSALQEFQRHCRFEFAGDSGGYDASDGKSSAHISWEAVKQVIEAKHAFHIMFGRFSPFVVVPKRSLTTDQATLLREILRSCLPGKVKLRG
jgi:hypothetical protein